MLNYYLFRSSRTTYSECIDKMLVGQKEVNSADVLNIKQGDIIFLHYTGKYLPIEEQFVEGPYFALTNGKRDIEPTAWNGDFPYQVKIEKKGDVARIKQGTFEKFSLGYSVGKFIMQFKLPDYTGKRLINELGIEIKPVENKIIVESWNVIDNVDIDIRLRYEAKYRCEDGHYVRSKNEVIIDNWLYNHYIPHAYEKKVQNYKMLCDFYLKSRTNKEIYIEIWGLKDEKYLNRKKQKIEIYKQNKLNLINIDEKYMQNYEDLLMDKLSDFL